MCDTVIYILQKFYSVLFWEIGNDSFQICCFPWRRFFMQELPKKMDCKSLLFHPKRSLQPIESKH